MKVVFVALGQEQLGISMLSAVLRRAGHDTSLVFDPALFEDRYYFDIPVLKDLFRAQDRLIDEIVEEKPDLLAFSVLTMTYTWALAIAKRAKERLGVPVIFGGVHPSAVPEVCLENDCVDFVCVGEGEDAIVALCDELDSGRRLPRKEIANLWWRGESGALVQGPAAAFVKDLDALPFWDKELWEEDILFANGYYTMTSRGCPYRCSFCFNNYFAKLAPRGSGKYVRQRSVELSIEELRRMKARYGIRHINFTDDIFTVDKEWVRAFLAEYRRDIDVPFACLTHPRFIDDEMAVWLKDAGCDGIQMGIQSADKDYKRKQLLRMEKEVDLEGSLRAMKSAGLRMRLDHILGLPGEPRSAQELARELFVKYTPARINTFWLTHLPGIDLTKNALAAGLITQADMDKINRGETGLFRPIGDAEDERVRFYQKYDVLFKLFPMVPAAVRERLRVEHIPQVAPRLAFTAVFLADALVALADGDLEAWAYGKHYLHHIAKALPEILLGKAAPRRKRVRRPAPDKPAAFAQATPLY